MNELKLARNLIEKLGLMNASSCWYYLFSRGMSQIGAENFALRYSVNFKK